MFDLFRIIEKAQLSAVLLIMNQEISFSSTNQIDQASFSQRLPNTMRSAIFRLRPKSAIYLLFVTSTASSIHKQVFPRIWTRWFEQSCGQASHLNHKMNSTLFPAAERVRHAYTLHTHSHLKCDTQAQYTCCL